MKFPAPVSVKWIANLIGAELAGNAEGMATGISVCIQKPLLLS
jgi:UDP-3-O-[3-hydroxymyristoyl] glucosamine N-acyltransferase